MKKHYFLAALALMSAGVFAAESKPEFDVNTCKPEYPKSALLNEEQGKVTASFLISADGSVEDSRIDKSSGSRALDKATLKSIGTCKFKAGMKDGNPTKMWAKVEYVWVL